MFSKSKILILIVLSILTAAALCLTGCGGGNNNDDSEFVYDADYLKTHLTGDYQIKYNVTGYNDSGAVESTYSILLAHTNEGYFINYDTNSVDGQLFIKSGDVYYLYMVTGENGEYEKLFDYAYTQSEVDVYVSVCMGFMTYYGANAYGMKRNGSQTVAGKNCEKYTFDYSLYGVKAKYEYCIDKDTGICMKFSVSITQGSQKGGYIFECTEFKTSGISLPAHI